MVFIGCAGDAVAVVHGQGEVMVRWDPVVSPGADSSQGPTSDHQDGRSFRTPVPRPGSLQ